MTTKAFFFRAAWTLSVSAFVLVATLSCGRTQFSTPESSSHQKAQRPSDIIDDTIPTAEELAALEQKLREQSLEGITASGPYQALKFLKFDWDRKLLILTLPFPLGQLMGPFAFEPQGLKGIVITNQSSEGSSNLNQIHIQVPLEVLLQGVKDWPLADTRAQSKLLGGRQFSLMHAATQSLFAPGDFQISTVNGSLIVSLALKWKPIFTLTLPIIDYRTHVRIGSFGLTESDDGNALLMIKIDFPEAFKNLLQEWSKYIERLDSK